MIDDCVGAKFEILVDGETKGCRDTVLTAMGAAIDPLGLARLRARWPHA